MKKVLSVLFIVLTCLFWLGLPADTYAETGGDYRYQILDDGTAEITGYTGSETNLVIPGELDGYVVTSIDSNVFKDCKSIKRIELPESLREIHEFAFQNCVSLEQVEFNNGLKCIGNGVFRNCQSLESVDIPDTVVEIEAWAFKNCKNIVEINLGRGLESIGSEAFYGCNSIERIEFPQSLKLIRGSAFENCSGLKEIVFNEGLEHIQDRVFLKCKALETAILPDSVRSLGEYVFWGCTNLTQLELPVNITSIESRLVYNCNKLSAITIPEGVTEISESAFISSGIKNIYVEKNNSQYSSKNGVLTDKSKKTMLYYPPGRTSESFTTPAGITRIETYAFYENKHLKNLTLSNEITSMDERVFYYTTNSLRNIYVSSANKVYSSQDGVLMNKAGTKIIAYPQGNTRSKYTTPASVTAIETMAFNKCKLKEVYIQGKITKMGWGAFSSNALEKVTIGNQVTVIGEKAFSWCENLTEVKVGKRVKKIEADAFIGCLGLEVIKIPSSVTYIAEEALHAKGYEVEGAESGYYDADPIEKIYYAGSKDKWNKIEGASQYKPDKYNYCTKEGVKHNYSKVITKATRFHNGSYDTRCTKCGDIKAQGNVIYKINKINLSYAKAAYNGKVKTPVVTVTNSKGKKLTKGTDYTVKYEKGRKIIGTYTVTVAFKGKYYGTVKKTFDIVPKKAEIRSLTKGKQKITVKWKKVTSQITGYQIRYSTASDMSNAKTVKIANYKITSKTIKSLKTKKKYYVQVRIYKNAEGKTYYGNWSGKQYVVTR